MAGIKIPHQHHCGAFEQGPAQCTPVFVNQQVRLWLYWSASYQHAKSVFLMYFQVAEIAAWYLAVQWPQLVGTSRSSAPGSAETPARGAWKRLTCCPARRCPSTVWMYSDSVLCVGRMERLFLSTGGCQFRGAGEGVVDDLLVFCWIQPQQRFYYDSFSHTRCQSVWLYLCIIFICTRTRTDFVAGVMHCQGS